MFYCLRFVDRRILCSLLYIAVCAIPSAGISGEIPPADAVDSQSPVDALVRQWKERLGEVKSFRVRYRQIDYSATFKSKTETRGECLYAGDRRWKGHRDDRSEHWLRTGDELYVFSSEPKTVGLIDFGELSQFDDLGWFGEYLVRAYSEAPLVPFLVGLRVDALQKKYDVKITREDEDSVRLDLHPRHQDDAGFSRAQLLLDQETFHPRAVKLHDLNGRDSKLFLFDSLEINVPIVDGEFQPDLEGWRIISLSKLFGKTPD